MDSDLLMAKRATEEGSYLTNLRLFLWNDNESTKPNNDGLFVFNFDDNTCRFASFKLQSLCYDNDNIPCFVYETISRNNIVSTKDQPLLARQVSDYILSCFRFHPMKDLRHSARLVFVLDVICPPLDESSLSRCDQDFIEQGILLENKDKCVDGYQSNDDNYILHGLEEMNTAFFRNDILHGLEEMNGGFFHNVLAISSGLSNMIRMFQDESMNDEIVDDGEDLNPFYDDFSEGSESGLGQEVLDDEEEEEEEEEGDELNSVDVGQINGVTDECLEVNDYNLEEFNEINNILRSKYSLEEVATRLSNKSKRRCDCFEKELPTAKRARVDEVNKSLVKVKPTVEIVEAKEGNEKLCSICIDKLSNHKKMVKMVRCDHMFHKDCIFKWLPNNQSCPYCRSTTITDVYLHII